MTTRDRLMLTGIAAIALLLGVWFMAVSPEREKAAKVTAEVESARAQLATAESAGADARNARANYTTAYASLVSLGQAVPASVETPALIYQLDQASHSRDVQFSSISAASSSGAASSSSSSSSSSTSAAGSATASGGFTAEPFTFVFNGSFADLYKLLNQLENFTVQTPNGTLRVSGRLLTIDSVDLTPSQETKGSGGQGSGGSSGKAKQGELTGTITATAYVLPASEATLGNATPAGPAGATPAAGTSATTPAVVKVTP